MIAATPRNRIAAYLDPPPLPTTPAERTTAYTDAVFAAVATLQRLLADHDSAVALRAATLLLDMEKTRMRHHTSLPGTAAELPPLHEPEDENPLADHEEDETEPSEEEIEEARVGLQRRGDELGLDRTITRDDALRVLRKLRAERSEAERAERGAEVDEGEPKSTAAPASHCFFARSAE